MFRILSLLFTISFLLISVNAGCAEKQTESNHKSNIKQTNHLIPRSVLFSDPKYTHVRISPDGQHLAYMAPHQGVLNIWVGNPNQPKQAKALTQNKSRGVAGYMWTYNNNTILFYDDNQGNEDWRLYSLDIKTGAIKTLISTPKVKAQIMALSKNHPDEIMVGMNQRRGDFYDIYRLNIVTGKMDLVYENNGFSDFVFDHDLNVKLGQEQTPEGGAIVYTLDKAFNKKQLLTIPQEDALTTSTLALDKSGNTLYMSDSRGRNTSALVAVDLQTNNPPSIIGENNKADISDVMLHPTEYTIQGYSWNYLKQEWKILDASIQSDFDYLNTLAKGERHVISRTLDDQNWIVAFISDNKDTQYYFYDRAKKQARFLFSSKPILEKYKLTQMEPIVIKSRDGFDLVGYLSLPNTVKKENGRLSQPIPLILLVHGGPNARDEWGYDSEHQWLTNRGYAVLSVNFRGSEGFGKSFINAGNGEWGDKMHNDLIDSVDWAIKEGITSRDKVGIMGASYGGYASLIGLTKTPDVFACGIDIVGPSNLETLMRSIPAYWKPFYASLKNKIGGDPETEEGRKFLASRSPLTFVDQIKKPLLIQQGANDPRVKQAESEQIVNIMKEKNIPVTYVLYPDEGHGFSRPENRLSSIAVVEAFLAQHLGGEFEPIKSDFNNSSIEIKVGKEHIKALK